MGSAPNYPLQSGYQLLNYRIDRLLSRGGFSLVYRALDESGVTVAIKEYLPSGLALREQGDVIHATSADNIALFRHGMRCFFEEGRALARIVHPNVVRVLNFFRANETVYLVMQYERGRTLQEQIQTYKHAISENFIRHIFGHLLNGLREVHTHRLLHLDIKPANIYIRLDKSPLLLDFGAVRQTLIVDDRRVKPMYTPGFAPPEQYRNHDLLGPWSDIYSVGASMFSCLAGHAPQAADGRMKNDKLESAKKLWGGRFSDGLLEIIDWCLQLEHTDRPQSVFSLQKSLLSRKLTPIKRTFLGNMRFAIERIGSRKP